MKKVCILTTAHSPYDDRIYHREVVTLSNAGYHIVIIAPWNKTEQVSEIVKIVGIVKQKTRLGRFIKTAFQVFKTAIAQRADVYHFHDPDLLPWMSLLSIIGKRVVYDVHEYNSESISAKTWIPRPFRNIMATCVSWLESWTCKTFTGVITVNDHMASLYHRHCSRVVSVANYPLPWFMKSLSTLGAHQPRKRIIYVGGLNKERGYELIVKTMDLVLKRQTNAECLIVGHIDNKDVKHEYAMIERNKMSVHGIKCTGNVKLEQVPRYLLSARIGWIPFENVWRFVHSEPIKLFEYMAAGLPVVASELGFIAKIVRKTGCGILVPPSDPKAHSDAICYLLDHPDEAIQMGSRGKKAILEHFNWSHEQKKLLDFYYQIFSE